MSPHYNLTALWSDPQTRSIADLALALVAAHLIGDFVLQSAEMAANKRRTDVLLNHSVIHGVLAWVIAGRWTLGLLPLGVFVTHAAIDRWKSTRAKPAQAEFWIDQLAHLVVIGGLARWLARPGVVGAWTELGPLTAWRALVLLSGAVLAIRTCAVVIGFWVKPYLQEITQAGGDTDKISAKLSRGLSNGGRVIGQWERALIFGFILVGLPSAIGFLIAAKSIFRFGELSDRSRRMEAEYITIGTLMSFAMALGIGYATLAYARS